jgi:CO/xanthine dehydrogenase Mo-binding subunit
LVAVTLEQAEPAASLVEVEYKTDVAKVSFDAIKDQAFESSDVMGRDRRRQNRKRRKGHARGGRQG